MAKPDDGSLTTLVSYFVDRLDRIEARLEGLRLDVIEARLDRMIDGRRVEDQFGTVIRRQRSTLDTVLIPTACNVARVANHFGVGEDTWEAVDDDRS